MYRLLGKMNPLFSARVDSSMISGPRAFLILVPLLLFSSCTGHMTVPSSQHLLTPDQLGNLYLLVRSLTWNLLPVQVTGPHPWFPSGICSHFINETLLHQFTIDNLSSFPDSLARPVPYLPCSIFSKYFRFLIFKIFPSL